MWQETVTALFEYSVIMVCMKGHVCTSLFGMFAGLFGFTEAHAQAQPSHTLRFFDLETLSCRGCNLSASDMSGEGFEKLGRVESVRSEVTPPKLKLKVSYRPSESGPSFDVGSLGAGKGKMKSSLIHVGMDWDF